MAFYGMTYRQVRELPLVTFWMLNKNVDRISAEQDMRAATIGLQVQSGEGFKDLMDELRRQLGRIVDFDEGKMAMANAKRDALSEEDRKQISELGGKRHGRSR